jgi:hypothetical protein
MVEHVCNSTTLPAEAGRLQVHNQPVGDQSGKYLEDPISQKEKRKKKKKDPPWTNRFFRNTERI